MIGQAPLPVTEHLAQCSYSIFDVINIQIKLLQPQGPAGQPAQDKAIWPVKTSKLPLSR